MHACSMMGGSMREAAQQAACRRTCPQRPGLGGGQVGVQGVLAGRRQGRVHHGGYGHQHHVLHARAGATAELQMV